MLEKQGGREGGRKQTLERWRETVRKQDIDRTCAPEKERETERVGERQRACVWSCVHM